MREFFKKFRLLDIPLVVAMLLLQALGLTVLYSTSLSNSSMSIFWRQLLFAGVGLGLFFVFAFYNYHNLSKANRIVYPLILLLLFYVLFFARDIRGSSRWIDFGFFQLQPAEFAKVALVIVLARWFGLKQALVNSWSHIGVTLVLAAVPFVLVLLEPDLGSSLVIASIWGGMILISPISKRLLLGLFVAFLVVAGLSWQFLLHDYQKNRVEVFLDPNLDPKGKGYNVRQATIAVGSGRLFGRGLGKGLQSQLKFLPERQTDFVFAAAAEEIGFIGSSVLLGLYGFLLYRITLIIRNSKDYLGRFLAMGVFCIFFVQVLINIGMNMGVMPVTGIPLPFMSYGGSALFVVYIALGMIQNVTIQSKALRS